VCGANGQTYTNECLAVCAGAKVASQGPCKVVRSTRAGGLGFGTAAPCGACV
jgi:hypothetical protein